MRIKNLIESLNAQQRSVPQLPAQARARKISVLGAKTDPKHPFAGYMVGADESAEPGAKRLGPDKNDPWEQGWRANPAHADNPYQQGTREYAQWADGQAERQAQPNHYDEGVAEGRAGVDDTDTVGFSVNSEAAYTAVMKRFGDVIDHDETSGIMYAPAGVWPRIEMVAYDADGEGAVRDDGVDESGVTEVAEPTDDNRGFFRGEIKKLKDGSYIATNAAGNRKQFNNRSDAEKFLNGIAEGERNEMDTPAVQAALARMAERHKGEKWSKEQLAALGKRIAARGQKSVKEDDVEDFLARGGKITQVKPNRGPRNPGLSLGSKHIGGGGDGTRASRTGRGSKPQGKPVVAVESDVEEGWKSKLAGAALAGAAALGGGAAAAHDHGDYGHYDQRVDNPSWGTAGYDSHIKSNTNLTKTTTPNGQVKRDSQRRISDVTGPNAQGEYRVWVGQNGKTISSYLTKTPPQNWMVKEDVTKEDIISKLKARLGDYLSDISKEIKKDPDLVDKLAAKPAGNQMGPPVKTVTTDDGHEIQIHGNEDDGFRISIKNKPAATKFANLDEAVMACEMYCARRRSQTLNADYVEEA
jgi:hypothetical protein